MTIFIIHPRDNGKGSKNLRPTAARLREGGSDEQGIRKGTACKVINGNTLVINSRMPAGWMQSKIADWPAESSIWLFLTPTSPDQQTNAIALIDKEGEPATTSNDTMKIIAVSPDGSPTVINAPVLK